MAKENSEQREMIQEESPLSAELDAELENMDEDSGIDLSEALPVEDALSAKLDAEFEADADAQEEVEVEETPKEVSEAEEAAEVLKETETAEPEKKSAEDGKVDAITALRAANRAKDQAIEALRESIAAAKAVEPVKKTPIEAPIEAPIERHAREAGYENSSDPDFSPSYTMLKEQMDFEKQQETQTVNEKAASDANQRFKDSCADAYKEMTVEKMGEGLDIGTIYDMGKDLLRKGDETNIYEAGTGQALYDECLAAIQRSGTQAQKDLLALRLKAQNEKTNTSDKTTEKKPVVKKPPKADKVTPTNERVGSETNHILTDFCFN